MEKSSATSSHRRVGEAELASAAGASPPAPLNASSSIPPQLHDNRAITTPSRADDDSCSHSSRQSRGTVEKGGSRRSSQAARGPLYDNEEGEGEEEEYSYSSYYDSYSTNDDDEEDGDDYEDDTDGVNSTSHGGSPSPSSPPPQEDLLSFRSFTLEDAALKDHRLMTIEAFRHVLLLGTNQGAVAVVEVATGRLKNLIFNHREPISDVDCTVNELFVAASDKAGYVSIQNRRDMKDVWISQLGMPIESVALHPLYHKMDSGPLVCGGGTKVIVVTKGTLWSNARRVTTLQEGRGRIHRVRWCHRPSFDVIAWLSDQEITLYDVKNKSVVRRVPLPTNVPQNALYPPTLRWERPLAAVSGDGSFSEGGSSAVLLCGWGDVVQEMRVSYGTGQTPASSQVGEEGGGSGSSDAARYTGAYAISSSLAALQTSMAAPFQQRPSPSTGPSAAAPNTSSTPAATVSAATVASATGAAYSVELRTVQPLRPSRTPFPYRVCGIAPYGPQRYVVLASIIDPQVEGVMKDLEVRVVERSSLLDVYRGRMPVRFIHPLQLHLAYLDPAAAQSPMTSTSTTATATTAAPADPLAPSSLTQYFILSVDAIVKATPADMDDHVEFLLRSGQFEKAYAYASLHIRQLRRHVLQQVGHQWLLHLFESRETDSRAILKIVELLPELVPPYNSLAWEQWIYRLDTCGESWRLVALLPGRSSASAVYHVDVQQQDNAAAGAHTAASPLVASPTLQVPIQPEYYNLVLLRCLRHDPNLFFAALHKFESLFTVPVVLKATEAAYREHCGTYAWWSIDDGEDVEDNGDDDDDGVIKNGKVGGTGAHDTANEHVTSSSTKKDSEPTSPKTKEAKGDAAAAGAGRKGDASRPLNRTARWSLAASYGFLLRCAGRFEEAMQTFMHLPSSPRSDKELFGLIRSEQLFRKTLEVLPELLQRRGDSTLALLMEHVAPPSQGSGFQQLVMSDERGLLASSPSPSASPNTSQVPRLTLEATQFGSPDDPLNVEAVVDRLEKSDRLLLLRYLDLVKEVYPKRFVETAKRHAQLVATLYIDYDRSSLLPFLKQMSMYVERIRELHALCHKNNFVEEEIFLLFRMGREEEALRILLEKMHDIHRALEFVVSIPDREEQAALFVRLIDFTVSYNASLPCRRKQHDEEEDEEGGDSGYDAAVASGGIRYVLHHTQPGETYATIAHAYHVSASDLVKANDPTSSSAPRWAAVTPSPKNSPRSTKQLTGSSKGGNGGEIPTSGPQSPLIAQQQQQQQQQQPPPRCVVPLNLFGALLDALADPQFSDHPALDVRLVLRKLPKDEPIPHAGASVAAIAHTMAEENAFLSTVSEVGERDLMGYYSQLLKRRTAAIAMGQSSPATTTAAAAASRKATRSASTPGAARAVSAADSSGGVMSAHRCAACHQLVSQQVVVFGCQHMYHPGCVLHYVRESANDGVRGARQAGGGGDAAAMILEPAAAVENPEEALRKLSVYCRVCRQHSGDHHH